MLLQCGQLHSAVWTETDDRRMAETLFSSQAVSKHKSAFTYTLNEAILASYLMKKKALIANIAIIAWVVFIVVICHRWRKYFSLLLILLLLTVSSSEHLPVPRWVSVIFHSCKTSANILIQWPWPWFSNIWPSTVFLNWFRLFCQLCFFLRERMRLCFGTEVEAGEWVTVSHRNTFSLIDAGRFWLYSLSLSPIVQEWWVELQEGCLLGTGVIHVEPWITL